MNNIAAVTICSLNYLSKAWVLFDSYIEHHPDHSFYVVLVDKKIQLPFDIPNKLNIVWVEDLNIPNLHQAAFAFDVIEFNTNVKPAAMMTLLERHEGVIYLDPDVEVFDRLEPVLNSLSSASVIVTPHCNTPILDGHKPDDLEFMRFGTFNLGFVAVSKTDEAYSFLHWWSERCLQYGFYEPQAGLAVDQKWVGLAPSYFPNLKVLHDCGLNLAFWNLHERDITLNNDKWFVNENTPLRFVHFSSFDAKHPERIAKKQDRFKAGSRPDFTVIAKKYADKLQANPAVELNSHRYTFDYFEDGTYICPTLRRYYAAVRSDVFPNEINPFKSDGPVRKFAAKNGLLTKLNTPSPRHTFKDIHSFGWQRRIILLSLKLCLRVLGPERYFNLMRYLGHISSLRNQADILDTK